MGTQYRFHFLRKTLFAATIDAGGSSTKDCDHPVIFEPRRIPGDGPALSINTRKVLAVF